MDWRVERRARRKTVVDVGGLKARKRQVKKMKVRWMAERQMLLNKTWYR